MTTSSAPPSVPALTIGPADADSDTTTRPVGRTPRRTIRLRMILLHSGLFIASGAALLALTYLLVARMPVGSEHHSRARPVGPSLPGLPSLSDQVSGQRAADLRHLLTQSAIALAVMAVVSVGLGWLLVGRMLRPIRTITSATRRISASNLHERLALSGPRDELTDLGDTIDDLLARLDRAFLAQRQFAANASHELRTPLTLQRVHLETALTDPEPTEASWRAACQEALAAGAKQERLIDTLLMLARSEAGLDGHEPVDLGALTGRIVAEHRGEADRRGLGLHLVGGRAATVGDPRLLERLVVNLVDNALRHNLPGGHIEVRTGQRQGLPVLVVSNAGPVIPAAHVTRLFEPFQRLQGLRTGPGAGIGLSLVKAIATAHHAVLFVSPRAAGGLHIEIHFPSAADERPAADDAAAQRSTLPSD